jgi:hypothetical protein
VRVLVRKRRTRHDIIDLQYTVRYTGPGTGYV